MSVETENTLRKIYRVYRPFHEPGESGTAEYGFFTRRKIAVKRLDDIEAKIREACKDASCDMRATNCPPGKFLGPNSFAWKGGVRIENGYIRVRQPHCEEPLHRLIAEHVMGFDLSPENHVHHMDENRMNNDPDNLLVCVNCSEHQRLHWAMRRDPDLDQRKWIQEYRAAQEQPELFSEAA